MCAFAYIVFHSTPQYSTEFHTNHSCIYSKATSSTTNRVRNRLKCSFYRFGVVSISLCPFSRRFVYEQQGQKLDVRKNKYCLFQLRFSSDFRYSIVNYAFLLPNENVKRFFLYGFSWTSNFVVWLFNGMETDRSSQAVDLIYLLIYWHIFVLTIESFARQQREHNHSAPTKLGEQHRISVAFSVAFVSDNVACK